MCKPEPIKVPVEQACSVSVEGLKVRIGTVGCWQNPTVFLWNFFPQRTVSLNTHAASLLRSCFCPVTYYWESVQR